MGLAWARNADAGATRAAIIGHTGRGDYGHDLDLIFQGRPAVRVVGVADPDPAGRKKARARSGAEREYEDYRDLLREEHPALVSVGMRHADQHREVIRACLDAGAHVYCEKPFTMFPAESDELLAEAQRRHLKIAVAHNMRLMPATVALQRYVASGQLGELVEMRAYGKQDARAGGEDMMVLGTHLFDLMRLLAGPARSCTAEVWQGERPITRQDARVCRDHVGWVAGDRVFASFQFGRSVTGTFTSAAALKDTIGHWGLELYGSKGVARLLCDLVPVALVKAPSAWGKEGRRDEWKPIELAGITAPPTPQFNAVSDWLRSIETDQEPACSGTHGAAAVEMAMAVYTAALSGRRVDFPLTDRRHPLET